MTAIASIAGEIFGTPAYMSPEQVARFKNPIDRRTDVYSLGATFYELLTLRLPFESENFEALFSAIISEYPTAPRKADNSIPIDLEAISTKCLEKRPNDRYATADEVGKELIRFADNEPVKAQKYGISMRQRQYCRRQIEAYGGLQFFIACLYRSCCVTYLFSICVDSNLNFFLRRPPLGYGEWCLMLFHVLRTLSLEVLWIVSPVLVIVLPLLAIIAIGRAKHLNSRKGTPRVMRSLPALMLLGWGLPCIWLVTILVHFTLLDSIVGL
jgi:hypothetical protein